MWSRRAPRRGPVCGAGEDPYITHLSHVSASGKSFSTVFCYPLKFVPHYDNIAHHQMKMSVLMSNIFLAHSRWNHEDVHAYCGSKFLPLSASQCSALVLSQNLQDMVEIHYPQDRLIDSRDSLNEVQ